MIRSLSRAAAVLLLTFVALVPALSSATPEALAQVPVVGTADFRNAPLISSGTYTDRIVSGDSAWYALVYTNETPYRFEVSIPGFDLNQQREISLTASFIAPTLNEVGEPATVVSGSGVIYPSGATNIWFLRVAIDTTGTPGVEYSVLIDVAGVESTSTQDCSLLVSCDYDQELEAVRAELNAATEELNGLSNTEQLEAVEFEIENLKGFASSANQLAPSEQRRLERAQARLAELCAPETTCDTFPTPAPTTAIAGWAIGAVALIGGAYIAIKKYQKASALEPVDA